jgi:hypothetical protein
VQIVVTITKSERGKQIIKYVKNNPFCSRYSIFTKGGIPKSSATNEIFNELVSKKKIHECLTKNKKSRYYIESKNWELDLHLKKFECESNKIIIHMEKIAEHIPQLKPISKKYSRLLDTRIGVSRFEEKYVEEFNEVFDAEGIKQVNQYFNENIMPILQKTKPSSSKIKKIEKKLDFEISRDEYYLSHEAKAVSILSEKIYTEYEQMRNLNKRYWIRKDRSFQKVKVVRLMRPVYEMIEISKDRHKYGLSRQNQIYHEQRLKKPDQIGTIYEFDEIFKRLNAERHRIIYKNPDITENQIMIWVTETRLTVIDKDHFKSRNYKQEKKNLHQFIKELEDDPTILHYLK